MSIQGLNLQNAECLYYTMVAAKINYIAGRDR